MDNPLPPVHFLAIPGSLRRGSYNRAVLHAARELQPPGMDIEIADLSPLPFYNEDAEAAGWPDAVATLRRQVAAADALLIATPEYNYSVPGVLKNALDWLSRADRQHPENKPPLDGKPLGIVGASTGQFGTTRAQLHLRQICVYTNLLPMNKPEVLIGHAADKFDAQGQLTDIATRSFLRTFLQALLVWTRRHTAGRVAGSTG